MSGELNNNKLMKWKYNNVFLINGNRRRRKCLSKIASHNNNSINLNDFSIVNIIIIIIIVKYIYKYKEPQTATHVSIK